MAFGWDDAAIIGLSLISGLLGGGNQNNPNAQYHPFSGSVGAQNMMEVGTGQVNELMKSLANLANQPVHLQGAYAQGLPGFSGGGLPMSIGAPARDPGFSDLPGLGLNTGRFGTANPMGQGYPSVTVGGAHTRGDNPPLDKAVPRGQTAPNPFAPHANAIDEAESVLDMLGFRHRQGQSMIDNARQR